MKIGIKIALLASLLSTGIHLYLAKRSYELQSGQAKESQLCHISEQINCDPALLSSWSRVFGVSLSSWGFAFNLALTLLLGLFLLRLLGLNDFWKNLSFSLAGAIGVASLLMIAVSLIMGLTCPLCWATYLLSGFSIGALVPVFWKNLSFHTFGRLFKDRISYILAGLITGAALFTHISFVVAFDIKSLEEENEAAFIDWQIAEPISFEHPPVFRMGPESSQMIVVEFADFLCPHCKSVSPSVHQFLETHPKVSFHFYSYPLDDSCNPEIKSEPLGLSCRLTKALICGEKQKKGVDVYYLIFDKQEQWIESRGQEQKIADLMADLIQGASLNSQDFSDCMKSPETENTLNQTVQTGNKALIPGTPSFFINGKLWRGRGHLGFGLQALYDYLN
ncbi:MAG: thioredoxin domain-containing protein [Bdellovibrionales bacterium]|nr:thioredoxin domain-containing protein [Bdellovibrionales bacterium]